MARNNKTKTKERVRTILDELKSFVEDFDVDNPEDAQTRKDALISAFVDAGLLKFKKSFRTVSLEMAISKLTIDIPEREGLESMAEMFEDLITSYGGDPPLTDMQEAKELLEEIVQVLLPIVTAELEGIA
jgi:hypothetical protein